MNLAGCRPNGFCLGFQDATFFYKVSFLYRIVFCSVMLLVVVVFPLYVYDDEVVMVGCFFSLYCLLYDGGDAVVLVGDVGGCFLSACIGG